jgi:hypothetical protein
MCRVQNGGAVIYCSPITLSFGKAAKAACTTALFMKKKRLEIG